MKRHVVRVYDGLGCSEQSLAMLIKSLRRALDGSTYAVRTISPQEILQNRWQKDTALIAFGGGYDRGYLRALDRQGLALIRQYVHEGGAYLGLCAGGYMACDYVQFDKGGDMEVCGGRDLKFYPDKCIGPAFPGFQYNSEAGAHAAKLYWLEAADSNRSNAGRTRLYSSHQTLDSTKKISDTTDRSLISAQEPLDSAHRTLDSAHHTLDSAHQTSDSAHQTSDSAHDQSPDIASFSCYFNGGGYFAYSTENPKLGKCRPMAVYADLPGCPPAVVQCRSGNGRAVLTGVHPEYIMGDLDHNNPKIKEILPQLKIGQETCRNMFVEMLKWLGMSGNLTKSKL